MKTLLLAVIATMGGASALSPMCVSAQVMLPEIVVTGNYYPDPIFLGVGAMNSSMLWSWPNTDTGDLYGHPSDGGGVNEICALLSITGRPEGCDRNFVQEFAGVGFCTGGGCVIDRPSMPPVPPIGPWQASGLFPYDHYLATRLRLAESAANYNLPQCYVDPSQNPDFCEDQYLETLDVCDDPRFAKIQNATYYCELGMQQVRTRIDIAREGRFIAEWVDVALVAGSYGLEANINLPFDNFYLSLHPYNKMYVWLRKGDACEKWYRTWDAKNCRIFYGDV